MQAEALRYAARGWRVHPLIVKEKRPLLNDWPNQATTDARQVETWWARSPEANIGVATGKSSGIFVVDIDGPEGERSWTQIVTEVPEIPEETLEQKTGRGRQLFYKYPGGKTEVRNRTNMRPGIDIRGEGGYVVVPPSIHPDGPTYSWPYGDEMAIEVAPKGLLNIVVKAAPTAPPAEPEKKAIVARPWDAMNPANPSKSESRLYERAKLYLDEIPPAIQGFGGHDALLWAARCLVRGFDLPDSDARSLLQEWNAKCQPPWDLTNQVDNKDFFRKLEEARFLSFNKPVGWLKAELGLMSSDEITQQLGSQWSNNILASDTRTLAPEAKKVPATEYRSSEFIRFPVEEVFPPTFAEFIRTCAEAYGVDPSIIGMTLLACGGTAMGNAFRLRLKAGYEVPPVIWFGVIAESGQNKTAPLAALAKPLADIIPMDKIGDSPNTPVHRMLVSNVTVAAVLQRLGKWPRGAMCFRDEMAGWIKSFDVFTKGKGGDEQDWLEFYNGHRYILDRKTDDEEIIIPAAAVSFVGGIQPELLQDCFTPGRFASGLVPRIFVTHPPGRTGYWSEVEISDELMSFWKDTVMLLRVFPFASLETDSATFKPNILKLSKKAKSLFVDYHNQLADFSRKADSSTKKFASKAQGAAARIAIPLHGFWNLHNDTDMSGDVDAKTMEGAITLMKWILNEQLRVYGLAGQRHQQQETKDTITMIRKYVDSDGVGSVRKTYRAESLTAIQVRAMIQPFVDKGTLSWVNAKRTEYQIVDHSEGE